jgi:hypothetical protein
VGQEDDGGVGGPGFAIEGVDAVDWDAAMMIGRERHRARVPRQDDSSNTSRAILQAVLAAGKPAYPLAW